MVRKGVEIAILLAVMAIGLWIIVAVAYRRHEADVQHPQATDMRKPSPAISISKDQDSHWTQGSQEPYPYTTVPPIVDWKGEGSVSAGVGGAESTRVTLDGNVVRETDAVTQLRAYAKAHHIHWEIICNKYSDEPHRDYLGTAWEKDHEPAYGGSIEDGNYPHWISNGPSQAAAAYDLLQYIKGPYNVVPLHAPPLKARYARICKPSIGSEIPVVLNSNAKCPDCGGEDQ